MVSVYFLPTIIPSKTKLKLYTVFSRKDAAATIYFSATAMQRLFEGGAYSRALFNSVTGTHMTCDITSYLVPSYVSFQQT